jgi:uncharacterized protein YidB (DUF937 family)
MEASMGLLDDILGGMSGAASAPGAGAQAPSGGGMSPVMMAIVALLAQRGLSGSAQGGGGGGLGDLLGGLLGGGAGGGPGRGAAAAPPGGGGGGLGDLLGGLLGGGAPRGAAAAPGAGGGISDLLGGLLGGAGGAGSGGNILAGGLGDLMKQFEQRGQGETARSWVGPGQNRPISPNELRAVLGDDTVSSLAEQAGLSQIDLLQGMSRQMPGVIDRLTPHGRLPTEREAREW